jgi:hypothetical protein
MTYDIIVDIIQNIIIKFFKSTDEWLDERLQQEKDPNMVARIQATKQWWDKVRFNRWKYLDDDIMCHLDGFVVKHKNVYVDNLEWTDFYIRDAVYNVLVAIRSRWNSELTFQEKNDAVKNAIILEKLAVFFHDVAVTLEKLVPVNSDEKDEIYKAKCYWEIICCGASRLVAHPEKQNSSNVHNSFEGQNLLWVNGICKWWHWFDLNKLGKDSKNRAILTAVSDVLSAMNLYYKNPDQKQYRQLTRALNLYRQISQNILTKYQQAVVDKNREILGNNHGKGM